MVQNDGRRENKILGNGASALALHCIDVEGKLVMFLRSMRHCTIMG